ncbi:hypothetical protein GCM10009716_35640 [Streptomyces sodiiphilus]|uniref:Uncharacterized protein n=1 Tax=Streptomyces sodiiphilus TaxID=226217 RepID=A0ABN2PM32_9ACTN
MTVTGWFTGPRRVWPTKAVTEVVTVLIVRTPPVSSSIYTPGYVGDDAVIPPPFRSGIEKRRRGRGRRDQTPLIFPPSGLSRIDLPGGRW